MTRVSVLPFLLLTTVVATLLPHLLSTSVPGVAPISQRTPVIWKAAYSERFPGCVASVLWPSQEKPVAMVVKAADGTVARVSTEVARLSAGSLRPIGACRSSH